MNTNHNKLKDIKQQKQSKIKSSLRLKSKTPLQKEQIHKINTILMHLNNHNDSIDFREPVDWKGLQLYDYLDVVKHPMDLSTINNKMRDKKYRTVQAVLNDIQLIWDNCKLYNSKESIIYQIADKLQLSFRRMVRNYLPNLKVATVTSTPIAPITQPPFIVLYQPERDQVQNKVKPNLNAQQYKSKLQNQTQTQPQIQTKPKTKIQSQRKNVIPGPAAPVSTSHPASKTLSQIPPDQIKKQLFSKIYTLSQQNLDKLLTNIKQLTPTNLIQTQQGWAKLDILNIQTPTCTKLYSLVLQMQQIDIDQQDVVEIQYIQK